MKLRATAVSHVRRQHLLAFVLLSLSAVLSCGSRPPETAAPLTKTRTLAGQAGGPDEVRFGNPFGVAVAEDGTIFVTDGEKDRLSRVATDGAITVVAENLNTPSAVALASDGALIVADTGSHTVKRIEPQAGAVKILAGVDGRAGFRDGAGAEALFDGPIGVTVNAEGTIFVADTYNDRIRAIDSQGTVRTLAGGAEPGHVDAPDGAGARFHTPCGVAVMPDGALVVADTGNHRLRRVEMNGAVTTIAGTGEPGSLDGVLTTALFDEPVGVAVNAEGTIYVADAGGSLLRACAFKFVPQVMTLAGGRVGGFIDGPPAQARFNHPSGIAVARDGALIVADTGNRAVRVLLSEESERGHAMRKEEGQALRQSAADFRRQGAPRWPFEPPERTREIAATFGEIRGEITEGKDAWFHNGLDIPGAYGETVRLVREERVMNPLAVEGTGTARERVRFPALGYIHLRVGRDRDDKPFADERFRLLRSNDGGRIGGVRLRRGARFKVGDALGTLNNQYHVHLISGPVGAEFNALAALELPGVRDTVAPVIEPNGVLLLNQSGVAFNASSNASSPGGGGKQGRENEKAGRENGPPVNVSGDVRIVVRAYDQMDGNAARRRLGLYRLGYQILKRDGQPAPGFAEPLMTISFESLPDDPATARYAYNEGSQSGYTSQTVFAYILTNRVRDREAIEDYWHSAELAPGDYLVRVLAEDFFGNRTTREISVRVGA